MHFAYSSQHNTEKKHIALVRKSTMTQVAPFFNNNSFSNLRFVLVYDFSKGVNDSSKVSTCSVKRLSTTSGNRVKTVNQNQEKT